MVPFGKVKVITSKILRSQPWFGWPLWNICVTNDNGYVPLAVTTSRLTWLVPLVEQELITLPEHLSVPPVFSGVRVTRSLIVYVCFVDRCLSFCTFSFGHCVVCSSSIYRFWLLLWYLQALFAGPNYFTKKRERSYICVLEVSILPLSTILRFKFGIVPTAKSILFSSYSNMIRHCGDQFHWWRIVEYPKKKNPPGANHWKVYHMILHRVHLAMKCVRTHNFGGDMH